MGKGDAEGAEHVPDIRLMSDYTWNRALAAASLPLAQGELGTARFSAGMSSQSLRVGPRFQKYEVVNILQSSAEKGGAPLFCFFVLNSKHFSLALRNILVIQIARVCELPGNTVETQSLWVWADTCDPAFVPPPLPPILL